MTNVTITFVSESVINIANDTAAPITFEISKLLITGAFDTADTLAVTNAEDEDYDFGTGTGIFKVWNPDASPAEGNTIIIVSTIVDELENDVKEILLADDIQKILPKGYDFVMLVLLSVLYIGNTQYQNALYSAGSLTDYTRIAVAIDRCDKYLDRENNTPQSNNKLWQ